MKNAYKKKIETEMEMVEAKFAEFKFREKSLAADVKTTHAKQVHDLARKIDATKAKLKELDEARDDNWEQYKDGVDSTWSALQAALKDTVIMFEEDV